MDRATASGTHNRIPLFALLAANAVSLTGNVFTLIAIPWFVLQTTGSASQTGLTSAVAALPFIIAGLFGGALVDRFGFRRMSIVSDLASSVTTALIPFLYLTVGLEFWQLLVLVFLGGLLDMPGTTARAALLPDLATLAGMRLERVNAIEQMVSRGSHMLGAPLAGVVIALSSTTTALWFNSASFIISAAIVAICIPAAAVVTRDATSVASDAPGGAMSRYLADLRAGLSFIRHDSLTLAIAVAVACTNFLDAMIGLAYPVYAEQVFDSAVALGLLMAAFGVGAVASTLAFAAIGHRMPRRETFIGCFILSAVLIFPLALTPPLIICLIAMAAKGVAAGPINPVLMTVSQERIPTELRGRVFGVLTSLAWIAIPAGRLGAGVLIEAFGLIPTLVAVACLYVAVTTGMFLMPALRQMNAPSPILVATTAKHSTTPRPPSVSLAEGRD